MMDKYFQDLLARYANGQCTKEEVEKLHRWYEHIGDSRLDLDEVEKRELKERMLQNISKVFPAEQQEPRKHIFFFKNTLKIAAALLVGVLCTAAYFAGFFSLMTVRIADNRAPSHQETIENNTAQIKRYTLSDGSTVQLEPKGKIFLPSDFSSDAREIHLTGKAFFEIVSDPARPFYVYSGTVATRVLGTSFFVDASANSKKVEVKVVTGRVSVFQIKAAGSNEKKDGSEKQDAVANGVVLSPNQKVEYFIEEDRWVTGLVEEPLPLNTIQEQAHSLVFADTPIKEVFEAINKRYGIEMVTENEKIYQCTFTGDVSSMSLYDMLDVISNSIGSTYEVKGTRILVSGKGCN